MKISSVRIILPFVLFVPHFSAAQVQLEWVDFVKGPTDEYPFDLVVDGLGNSYTAGHFNGAVDFDPGPGVYNLTSTGIVDMFIFKLDANGNFQWAHRFGNFNFTSAWNLDADPSGNILITGFFEDSIDFDPGPGTVELFAVGSRDIFVLKLAPDGSHIWARTFGGFGEDVGTQIVTDDAGKVYLTGYCTGFVIFDSFGGIVTGWGSHDLYVLKLDTDGTFIWVRAVGSFDWDEGWAIAVDPSGNVITTGVYFAPCDFDPGPGDATLTPVGERDIFIQKLDANGNFLWVKNIGGAGVDESYGIDLGNADNIYVTGYFELTADFDPGGGAYPMTSYGQYDAFALKLDPGGSFLWAHQVGGLGFDWGYEIVVDNNTWVYLSGPFSDIAEFDDGPGTETLTSNGYGDIFLARYNLSGSCDWAVQVGGPDDDNFAVLDITSGGKAILGGNYEGLVDFDPGTGTFFDGTDILGDLFVLQLCPTSSGILVESVCDTYTSPTGKILTSTGIYYDTLANSIGCDSIIEISLTVNYTPAANAGPDSVLCDGIALILTGGGTDLYTWDNGVLDNVAFSPPLGTTAYALLAESPSGGCQSTDTVVITVYASPVLVVTPDQSFCPGDSVWLSVSGADTYDWWSGYSALDSIVLAPQSSLVIEVKGFIGNCSDSANVELTIQDCPEVLGNTLTPNGDGLNDFLEILGIENYPGNEVSVLDRWGSIVFHTEDYDNSDESRRWQGMQKSGDVLNAGTYYYVVRHDKYNGQTGWVQLIR